ncbi:MAG: 1,4-dihydroxy-6-naphthoate synthase [Saprospiraceae bacterium]|nr:1,4-dihydroxy-6-naphthoate synthase [Saprospiraceae bacterium]
MTLSLEYSPCPNDTFIFYAMMHGKVDTEGLSFEVHLDDVEALNQAARKGEFDITKLSFHALAHIRDQYDLLDSGAALGNNCGPLLISKKPLKIEVDSDLSVAIPGQWTTANFLLSYAYPQLNNRKEMLFSKIENAVLKEEVDLGLIIHENRFTYQEKGLHKVVDLGEFWEGQTGLPIPLGGIAIHSRYGDETKQKVERVIRRSLEYAWDHVEETLPYLKEHAQEMDEAVMMQHVNLYVNGYTMSLGANGQNAVEKVFEKIGD